MFFSAPKLVGRQNDKFSISKSLAILKKSKYLAKGIISYIFFTRSSSQFLFNKKNPVHFSFPC